jgi:hypothetical protein
LQHLFHHRLWAAVQKNGNRLSSRKSDKYLIAQFYRPAHNALDGFLEKTMNVLAGERYRCSDSNCGCEIEITAPSAVQDDSEDDVIGSPNDRSIVGSLFAANSDSRHPQAAALYTTGDYGAQGFSGKGAPGATPRSTALGRLASTSMGSFKSNFSSTSDMESDMESGSTGEATFSCCCGQPMRKSSSRGQSSTRVMG